SCRWRAARWRALPMRRLVSSSLSAPTTSTCSRACLSACSTRSFLPKLSAAALARILVPSCITRCKLINPSALNTPKLCTNNSSSAAWCLTRKSVNVCALTTRAPVNHSYAHSLSPISPIALSVAPHPQYTQLHNTTSNRASHPCLPSLPSTPRTSSLYPLKSNCPTNSHTPRTACSSPTNRSTSSLRQQSCSRSITS